MARPVRRTADYFPVPASFYQDRRVRALLQQQGHVGFSVLLMLYSLLCSEDDQEIRFVDEEKPLLAADFGVELNVLSDIVRSAVALRLLTLEDHVLSSDLLRMWLEPLYAKRRSWSKSKQIASSRDNSADSEEVFHTENTTEFGVFRMENGVVENSKGEHRIAKESEVAASPKLKGDQHLSNVRSDRALLTGFYRQIRAFATQVSEAGLNRVLDAYVGVFDGKFPGGESYYKFAQHFSFYIGDNRKHLTDMIAGSVAGTNEKVSPKNPFKTPEQLGLTK